MAARHCHLARADDHEPGGGQQNGPARTGDAELLAACRTGDRDAWAQLVARYERLVFSVALRNGLSRHDAADITQSTFLVLLDSIDRIREEDRLSFWLMTVARRQSWRLRERVGRESVLADIDLDQADPVLEWERSRAIAEALAELPEPCRELITALYLDPSQPTYAEIAQRMGRATGGLGPMRARCLARLRALMEPDSAW